MMGIRFGECCYIFGDNQSMLVNSSMPDSILRKKSNFVPYHFVCKGTARDEWKCTYVESEHNHSDLLTKIIPNGDKRIFHVQKILNWIQLLVVHVENSPKYFILFLYGVTKGQICVDPGRLPLHIVLYIVSSIDKLKP